jgi:glycosyltransferase involved in cell wall biosynthesis
MNITVVIPAFNASPFLSAAIESALHQSPRPHAVIVVDDGSHDQTLAIAHRYGPPVLALHQPNQGVAAARNTGAAHATTDWLLFLDADDQLLPGALAALSSHPSAPSAAVLYGQSVFVDTLKSTRRLHGTNIAAGPVPTAAHANFWRSVMASPGAALVRKSVFESIRGFRTTFDTLADRDLWIRIGLIGEFAFIPQPVLAKHLHTHNMSTDRNRSRIQAVRVQLSLFDWCRDHNMPPSILQTSIDDIITRNLSRALADHTLDAALWIQSQAACLTVDNPLVRRARRLLSLPAGLRHLAILLARYTGKL